MYDHTATVYDNIMQGCLFSYTTKKTPQYRCCGGCVAQLQAEACKAKP